MDVNKLLLGVDGGGTRCRVRLCAWGGKKLGEAMAGPANLRLGIGQSARAVMQATARCLRQAGLSSRDCSRITACLAMAGASEPSHLAAARRHKFPFGRTIVTTDARAACVGAHDGGSGGVIVIGTGSIGWAESSGRHARVGGWGLPVSDEGSGAWLGCEVLRCVLQAHDGRTTWTPLLKSVFERFHSDPHAIVRWVARATPGEFGTLAPDVVAHASRDDPAAVALMRLAAGHVDALAARLVSLGADRLAIVGGLAGPLEPWLAEATRRHLVMPIGDALDGALQLARAAADPDLVEDALALELG